MTKSKDHLICFDLDGILISSMVIANRIFYDVVSGKLGLPLYDYPQQKTLMALSAEERIAMLWPDDIKKKGITHEQIEKALQIYRDEKMAAGIPLLPHAKEAVILMAEHFKNIACVSSNPDYLIDETLSKLGLRPYFSKITGLDHVQFSKPHPEMYRVTAEYFNINPKSCLVFEDSTHGIHAAKGAGMHVIAVATGLESVSELQKAEPNRILNDLSELSYEMVSEIF